MNKLNALLYYLLKYPIYKVFLKRMGFKSRIIAPLKIDGWSSISIGDNVLIKNQTWLAAVPYTGSKAYLEIGNGTFIGNFNHIFCTEEIIIGKKVLTADKVYISDNLHSYTDITVPILDQPIKQLNKVKIGNGAWLGENVCVIGANIGDGSVIGANSVVTKDIPAYCVAVGAPARIIKRYCFETKEWLKTDQFGNFLTN